MNAAHFHVCKGLRFSYFGSNRTDCTRHRDMHTHRQAGRQHLKSVPQYISLTARSLGLHFCNAIHLESLLLGRLYSESRFIGTDGSTRRLARQSWSPLLPREARLLALKIECAHKDTQSIRKAMLIKEGASAERSGSRKLSIQH